MRGGENQVLVLLRGLRSRGWESTLFAPRGVELARRAREEGVEVREVPFRSELDVVSMWRLRRQLARLGASVVHFHDAHAVTLGGIAAALAGLRARVATRRVVFPLASAWKWRRLASRVIAISEAVRRVVIEGGVPGGRVSVVYSAVNEERFRDLDGSRVRRELGLAEARVVTCAAALTPEKGHEDLLVAMSRVAPEFPDAVLLLAGAGPLEGDLRERARALRLGDRVRFLGAREDLPDVLAASDVFVMPSHSEGLGSAVLEAVWCGVPAVVTDAGGLPETVAEFGRVVGAGDPRSLATGLELALGRPEESKRLARGARRRAELLFTADAMVEGTVRVYEGLL